ncbi:MAG: hypothetical protein WAU59_20360 [Rhodoplanes sp.]
MILGYPKDKQVWLKVGDQLVTSIDLEFKLASQRSGKRLRRHD